MILRQLQIDFQSRILQQKHFSKSQQRMQIYQNSYYERIIAALKQDFPIMTAMLGDAVFSGLVRDYIDQYPSQHFNLRYIGKNLSDFILEKDKSFEAYADLARLEYQMCISTASSEIIFESHFNVVDVYNAFYTKQQLIALLPKYTD